MPEDQSVRVVVLLNLNDIYRANAAIALQKRSIKRRVISTLAFVLSVSVLFYFVMLRSDPDFSWVRALVMGSALGLFLELVMWLLTIVAVRAVAYYGAKRLLKVKPPAAGPITYEFSSTGASYAGSTGDGHINWVNCIRIRETREQFLLYLQPRLANVIPKSTFDSDADAQRFRNLVRDYFQGEVDFRQQLYDSQCLLAGSRCRSGWSIERRSSSVR